MQVLSAHSMGAPFVFEPDSYMKGSASKEPFDLAWACNGCLVMMSMTRGNKSREQKFQHNVGALKGWLRLWSDELPLRGSNEYQTFEIRPGNYPHLVLLSIVDGRDSTAEYHTDILTTGAVRNSGAVFVATLPERALSRLAELGGSTRDLLALVNLVRTSSRTISESTAVAMVEALHRSAFVRAVEHTPGLTVDDDLMSQIVHGMIAVRTGVTTTPGTFPHSSGDAYTVLNDLEWEGLLVLLRNASAAVAPIAETAPGTMGPLAMSNEVTIRPYTFMIGAVNSLMTGGGGGVGAIVDRWREDGRQASAFPPINLLYYLDFFWDGGSVGSMYTVHRRAGRSATESAIHQWKAEQGL